ncbi:MAG: DUF5667 domain-containing protein, partial [Halobacteriales archaeon]|nr:DUF5667 domain-containing protein [Halobacteriales archaeon]
MSDRMQIWAILMVISMAFSGSAAAQVGGASLENPGLTPDSPFYFLDGIGESVQLAITLDPEAKIDLELEFAEEKVAEARAMAKEGNFDAMAVAENRHDAVLDRVETKIENLDTGENAQEKLETQLKIERKIKKHAKKVEVFEEELREEIIVELIESGVVSEEDQIKVANTVKRLEERAEKVEDEMETEVEETKVVFEEQTGKDGDAIEDHLKHELGIKQEEMEEAMQEMKDAHEEMMEAFESDGQGNWDATVEANQYLTQAMQAFESGDYDAAFDFADQAEDHIHDETFWRGGEGPIMPPMGEGMPPMGEGMPPMG